MIDYIFLLAVSIGLFLAIAVLMKAPAFHDMIESLKREDADNDTVDTFIVFMQDQIFFNVAGLFQRFVNAYKIVKSNKKVTPQKKDELRKFLISRGVPMN